MNKRQMQYRPLGEAGPQVSAICLGTMTFGQQAGEAEGHRLLDHAFERGINFIDTAEMYPVPSRAETSGATESIVGNWLARKPREKLVIATKVTGPARSLGWIRGGPPALDRANIRAAVEGSLRRLRTDYIDLYQLHWPERNQPLFGQGSFDPARERACTPIRAQLEALAELVEEGKIRQIGLSNEQPWGVMEFLRVARESGLPRVATVQNSYNLLNRVYEYGLSEISYREKVGMLAYSPLAFGHLSGKYLAEPAGEGRITLFESFGVRYTKPGVQPAVRTYVELARRHGLSPAALALAFVYSRWFVTSTIIGATTMAQLVENLDAWDVVADEDLCREIDAVHLLHTNPAP
ncbi:Predicted oxidoreductase [Thauera chlorobenzoica]|uniref:Protein tas n=2 Tax=Thauera chlorobenzoica TaxID=96773 RepID=A0A1H5XB13_9RHOO|nr:aldo/keto reductase Tas [Thauera chlorobenzoica]SEG08928.1 Predicted oxidoreductase [Thauera chlorobenzoica]